MKRRKSADQRMMDRARQPRMDRISGRNIKERRGSYSENGVIQDPDNGGKSMITVTRLNGEVLYLNVLQIESMESIPETKIKMMNGDYYLVKDSADSVIAQVKAFLQRCISSDGGLTK